MRDGHDRTNGWWRTALWTVPAIVIGGSLVGVAANSGFANDWYRPLIKPWFQPPGWAFGVVWTILYALMGVALAMILRSPDGPARRRALILFGLQLALNFAWSPVFFGLGMIDVALLVLIALFAAVVAAMMAAWRIRPVAGMMFLPYILWLCVALALNYETGRLNPGADRAPLGLTG